MNQRLKLAAICSFLILILAHAGLTSAQSKGDVSSLPFSTSPYRVGEKLTYNISFSNFISAAHVELEVMSRGSYYGREGIQLRAHVQTTGFVNAALLAMNNDYITYVDPQTGLPYYARQVVRESSRAADTGGEFNPSFGSARSKSDTTAIFDLLSAIYRLRALPLTEGSTYHIAVRGENEDYHAELRVSGREAIKTNVGSFNTLASQVRVSNNSRANDYRIRIFFSDDDRHLPVLITARLSAGEIRAELAGLEFVKPTVTPTPQIGTVPPPAGGAAQPPLVVRTEPEASDASLGDLPFKVGEQLTYQVFLANIAQPAGMATFQVRAKSRYFERDGLLFALQAQTTNAVQRMFFANDQISSYVDPKSLLPFRVEMKLTEGSMRLNQTLTINQDHGAATSDRGTRIEIPVGTHDYLSFFYRARTFDLSPSKRNAVSILVNNKPKTLYITVLKREAIQLGAQTVPAILLSLTTDDSVPDKFQLRVWVSDDKRHLPLRLTAMTELGAVRADLAIIPLTSQ